MYINFRQGIIQYPTAAGLQNFLTYGAGYVSLNASNGQIDIAFAHFNDNYLLSETISTTNAWGPIPAGQPAWLYWDINLRTGQRSYGFTLLAPATGITAPVGPVVDQHWFNTANTTMNVWNGTTWRVVARVFAARILGTTFSPLGSNPSLPYAGSQVGATGGAEVGRITFDPVGKPLRKSNGAFFTTVDLFYVQGSPVNTVRLESDVLIATAETNLGAYSAVKLTGPGTINYANYSDTRQSLIAMVMQGLTTNQTGTIVVRGTIANPDWRWTDPLPDGAGLTAGSLLWISENGELVGQDPHNVDNVTFPQSNPPIARVFDNRTIIFDPTGSNLSSGGVPDEFVETFNGRYGNVTLTSGDVTTALTYTPVNKAGDTMTGTLVLNANPAAPLEAATKQYVDATVAAGSVLSFNGRTGAVTLTSTDVTTALAYTPVNRAGDAMTGMLLLSGAPTLNLHAATKQYVDNAVGSILIGTVTSFNTRSGAIILNSTDVTTALTYTPVNKAGDTITGFLSLANEPTLASHAATKQYVDNSITGLDFKQSVRVATTASVTMSGLQLIDGVLLVAGDRILVKDQANAVDNGVYLAAGGAWTRSPDFDGTPSTEVRAGTYLFVGEGTLNASSGWVLTTVNPIVGTSPLLFTQFTGSGQLSAGNGLIQVGSSFNVGTVSSARIVVNPDNIDLAASGVAPGSYNNVVVDAFGRVITGSNATYLTSNQNITLTGDLTGTGSTIINASLANIGSPISNSFVKITTDAKGRVAGTSPVTSGDISALLTATYVLKTGDTMTGALTLSGNPTANLHAATKQYVDSMIAGSGVTSFNTRTGAVTLTYGDVTTALTYAPVNRAGDTMSGLLILSGNPVSAMHAATKQYVDQAVSSIPVGVASFNSRTGAVTLTSGDVTTALGYTPANPANFVQKAGDTMTGMLNLRTYTETKVTPPVITSTVINTTLGTMFEVNLDRNTTVSFFGTPPTNSFSLTLFIKQDAVGGRMITWPASVRWSDALQPSLTATPNKTDIVSFVTIDGGATWFGNIAKNF